MSGSQSIVGILVLVMGIVLGTSPAEAVVLCAKMKNPNKVKLRGTACKRSESVVLLGPESTPPAPAGQTLEALKAVDGAGSGLDADTLQSLTPEEVVPTPEETLAAIKAVGGAGSGLDADTVRGLTPGQIAGMVGGGTGQVRLVDSLGQDLGIVLEDPENGCVLRRINDVPIIFCVEEGAFGSGAAGASTLHESTDCSGTAYLQVFDFGVRSGRIVTGNVLVYAGPLTSQRTINSVLEFRDPGQCLEFGGTVLPGGRCCERETFGPVRVAPPVEFKLDSLGLVPPFTLTGF